MAEREFLIVNDYGMGGTWAKVKAENPEEVSSAYPCFQIVDKKPDWLVGAVEEDILTTDLNDATLKAICGEEVPTPKPARPVKIVPHNPLPFRRNK